MPPEPSPNDVLRNLRISMRRNQREFANDLNEVARETGEPCEATTRTVQRWESGQTQMPHQAYVRVLERLTGRRIEDLGFRHPSGRVHEDGRGGHDMIEGEQGIMPAQGGEPQIQPGTSYTGIWLSRYEFYSSGRADTFTGAFHLVLHHRGDRITAESLPGSSVFAGSSQTLGLTVDRSVVSGTWTEQTSPDGYYQGARYHGCIQLLVEPTGRRMAGKWVGFGRDMEVNTGPWDLTLVSTSTAKAAVDKYSEPPTL